LHNSFTWKPAKIAEDLLDLFPFLSRGPFDPDPEQEGSAERQQH
jgi:hypothetical protein